MCMHTHVSVYYVCVSQTNLPLPAILLYSCFPPYNLLYITPQHPLQCSSPYSAVPCQICYRLNSLNVKREERKEKAAARCSCVSMAKKKEERKAEKKKKEEENWRRQCVQRLTAKDRWKKTNFNYSIFSLAVGCRGYLNEERRRRKEKPQFSPVPAVPAYSALMFRSDSSVFCYSPFEEKKENASSYSLFCLYARYYIYYNLRRARGGVPATFTSVRYVLITFRSLVQTS